VYQVLSMCCTTINNFYEPLRKLIHRKLAARDWRRSTQATYNLQQLMSFEVKAAGSGADWFLGCSKEKRKRMAPTHARIITPFVPLGMFTEEQPPKIYEFPLAASPYQDDQFAIPGIEPAANEATPQDAPLKRFWV
jgi:hypothetical protein